jgi:hypothetical protein
MRDLPAVKRPLRQALRNCPLASSARLLVRNRGNTDSVPAKCRSDAEAAAISTPAIAPSVAAVGHTRSRSRARLSCPRDHECGARRARSRCTCSSPTFRRSPFSPSRVIDSSMVSVSPDVDREGPLTAWLRFALWQRRVARTRNPLTAPTATSDVAQGGGGASPSRTAHSAACVREVRSSLERMLLTCVRAVRSLITSSAAISLFALP